ncbi:MAG: hypothetical protein AABW47_04845 [Nanoarchaeota archaeon]
MTVIWLGSREKTRQGLEEISCEEMERTKRRTLLTDNINGKDIHDCKTCGEYLDADTNCPLINSDGGLCEKSFLIIEYDDKTKKYKLAQFGMK